MEYNRQYLDRLIADQIEESATLEYKSAASLDRKDDKKKMELSKDISAFANSAGGMIIYGIRETSGQSGAAVPERIDPVDGTKYSKEWLDQMISQIQPRIEGLRIIPVRVSPDASDYVYIVDVPQSTTAHQATDLRYYKRRNFESTAMEDYEIRDVMNRRRYPVLQAYIRVCATNVWESSVILVKIENASAVLARHYKVVVRIPVRISSGLIVLDDSADATLEEGDNGASCWRVSLLNSIHEPLFPKSFVVRKIRFNYTGGMKPEPISREDIHVTIYADEMDVIEVRKHLAIAESDWA